MQGRLAADPFVRPELDPDLLPLENVIANSDDPLRAQRAYRAADFRGKPSLWELRPRNLLSLAGTTPSQARGTCFASPASLAYTSCH